MNIKHFDIEIASDDPFKNCKLGRKKYAEVLSNIVRSYSNGFVLAINNEWGAGKTTFVKMWDQHLRNIDFKTLYFNAWENDFNKDPLVAIMSELKSLSTKPNDEKFKSLLKKGAIITKRVVPSIIKAVSDKYIKTDAITETIKNTTEAAAEIFKDEIDEYAKKKKGLKQFKKELEEYVDSHIENKPLILFIDEIDRCRPNYAVEILEYVKHFFSVPGIIFVLSIDKIQLCNSIKGYYGSESINADEYLKRFIDIEFNLPNPSTTDFCKYLYEYFQFDSFFNSAERIRYRDIAGDSQAFINFSTILFEKRSLSLRQQERIFAHARISINLFKANNYVFPTALVLLLFIRFFDHELYKKISLKLITPQNLVTEIGKNYKSEIAENNARVFLHTESLVLYLYFNSYREYDYNLKLVEKNKETNEDYLTVKSGITDEMDQLRLNFITSFESSNFYSVKIDYLLKIIDLTENLAI